MRKIMINFAGHSYKTARHRTLYENLAEKFKVAPGLVYLIAHGRRARNTHEHKIVRELFCANVIIRVGFGL
ncbi:MAG: hypothetical protein MJZ16_10665 [Bacteroidales bacterium]|nr:hypothetical protein [Bacteroidales bacterium]